MSRARCPDRCRFSRGISLVEVLAVVTLLGILAAVIVPRLSTQGVDAKGKVCSVHKGNVEVQCQLWARQKGSLPQSTLDDIGADASFFPDGLPVCPVDGSSYSIDTVTGQVTGHAH
ncbi:MAG: competence type IV pilus major pilin ComGC [Pirellulaceae bacterium]